MNLPRSLPLLPALLAITVCACDGVLTGRAQTTDEDVFAWIPDPENPGCVCHSKHVDRCRCSNPEPDTLPPALDSGPGDDDTAASSADSGGSVDPPAPDAQLPDTQTAPEPDSGEPPVVQDCTYYVAPNGSSNASGATASDPLALDTVKTMTKPGDTVCLLPGTYYRDKTFYPTNSGTPDKYITYRSHGGEARLVWTGASEGNDVNTIHFWKGPNYVEIRDLVIDSQNTSPYNIKCHGAHHLRLIGNTLLNGGAGGIGTKNCDYVVAIGNRVHHFGYLKGWSSGISLNSHYWSDNYPGIHSVVINNVISGGFDNSSYKSDGNGIILDLSDNSYDASTANTPPALVANNVVYQNGGRCINAFVVTNAWIVNNSCYKNSIDPEIGKGEITVNKTKDSYVLNNVVFGAGADSACYAQWTSSNIQYAANAYFNCGSNEVPSSDKSDPTKFFSADPQFLAPVFVDLSAAKPWELALSPTDITNQFYLQPTSPVIDEGIVPHSLPGLAPELAADLEAALSTDAIGQPRPKGAGWDLGAYEEK